MTDIPSPLRLRLDGAALAANWSWLNRRSRSAACGAAIKADGYGLGARAVVTRLAAAGCRDFFVANWAEAAALGPPPADCRISVLHGVRAEDMAAASAMQARPVLDTQGDVMRWRQTGRPCDVMVDTGMNRLGLSVQDVEDGLLDGLAIDTLMTHLISADEDVLSNQKQRAMLVGLAGRTSAKRLSLANSAGICLGEDYAFDLTRPGLALYGGVPRAEAAGHIRQVVTPEAQILQRRRVPAGASVGYNASYRADRNIEVAIVNLGYADGYLRGFSNTGIAVADDVVLPVVGRVSMDLLAIDVSGAAHLAEGDWVALDYDLPRASSQSGLSQYELLTGLGPRFMREWV